jgi:hypothetical protein
VVGALPQPLHAHVERTLEEVPLYSAPSQEKPSGRTGGASGLR